MKALAKVHDNLLDLSAIPLASSESGSSFVLEEAMKSCFPASVCLNLLASITSMSRPSNDNRDQVFGMIPQSEVFAHGGSMASSGVFDPWRFCRDGALVIESIAGEEFAKRGSVERPACDSSQSKVSACDQSQATPQHILDQSNISLDSQICTYISTGNNFRMQHWYDAISFH